MNEGSRPTVIQGEVRASREVWRTPAGRARPVTFPEVPPGGAAPGGRASLFELEDRELVRRCQAGAAAAFEPLVERYRQRVWRLAYNLLRDREEASDCAQEAFVRAYASLASFRGRSAFYTWLFRIAVNLATDRLRARGARARALGGEAVTEEEWVRTAADSTAGPDAAAARSEQRDRIRKALDALPLSSRTIIMLSDVEGLAYREMAEVLACPIGTVMSRLHNARRRLRALLGPMLALLLWVGLGLLGGAGPASADPMIRFGVRVLQASNPAPSPGAPALPGQRHLAPPGGVPSASPEAETDERLRRVLPRLRTLFRYTEYTTLERHRAEVSLGTQQRFPLPGSRQLEVTPDQLQGQAVRLRVRLLKGENPELRTNILAAPGAPAVLGGPVHGDGVLIIILWAHPNPSDRPSNR